jgi:hypothetical protein
MADTLYGSTPFTFPPLYPSNDMSGDNTDYVGKYSEVFGSARSGMSTVATSSSAMGCAADLGPNIYDHRPQSWLGWGQQDPTDAYHHHQQQRHVDLIADSAHPPPLSQSLSPVQSSMNGNHSYLQSVRYL